MSVHTELGDAILSFFPVLYMAFINGAHGRGLGDTKWCGLK